LAWKVRIHNTEVVTVERSGKLVGLATCVPREEGKGQWQISDVLSTDAEDSLRATLVAACNVGHERACQADTKPHLTKTGILAVPLFEPLLHAMGFRRDDYDFSLAVQILDASICKESVAPERWYLSVYD
jgi:hypothetical protein